MNKSESLNSTPPVESPPPDGASDDMDAAPERPGDAARRLMRACDRAALATVHRGPALANGAMDRAGGGESGGWPYPSLVLTALDLDGAPLLFLSRLAAHTANLQADPRVGLLFDGTADLDQPLAGARVSVLGRALRSDAAHDRERFLARHPGAAVYAGFSDFAVYRVAVERAHLVAGFGRIHWIDAADLLFGAGSEALAEAEAELVRLMNEERADDVQAFAMALVGRSDMDESGRGWRMTGIDPEGCDLRRGGEVVRVEFDEPVTDAEAARAALSQLARRARLVRARGAPAPGATLP